MLTKRQKEMIQEFERHSPSFLTADHFVEKFQVSMRTVQSDIKKNTRASSDYPIC